MTVSSRSDALAVGLGVKLGEVHLARPVRFCPSTGRIDLECDASPEQVDALRRRLRRMLAKKQRAIEQAADWNEAACAEYVRNWDWLEELESEE